MNETAYIVSAVRTPIGKFGGALKDFSAADLGVIALRAALAQVLGAALPAERLAGEFEDTKGAARASLDSHSSGGSAAGTAAEKADGNERAPSAPPWRVDEVIMGNARPAGIGPNLARQIAWWSGLGDDVPGFTVNMACASGLRAVMLGWQQIRLGEAEMVVAGGAESMSRVPYLLEARWGFEIGNQPLVDAMYRDGFTCPLSKMVMGETGELLASEYSLSRTEQDEFARESHQRAGRAAREGRFRAEMAPIERVDKKGNVTRMEQDEHVRADVTAEALAKLPPVFSKAGTVSAGNSSGITDGAAALVLVSERKLRDLKLTPLARIVDATLAAVDPRVMGVGPVPAVHKLMARTGTKMEDYDAVELNEAFAAQVLACDRELHFDRERLNPNGGAIALGHPIGCSGARILTSLVHELRRVKGRRGLATLCVSGGLGVAFEIEAM
jgi:acetyl-CoA C-acetyltransferase